MPYLLLIAVWLLVVLSAQMREDDVTQRYPADAPPQVVTVDLQVGTRREHGTMSVPSAVCVLAGNRTVDVRGAGSAGRPALLTPDVVTLGPLPELGDDRAVLERRCNTLTPVLTVSAARPPSPEVP